MNNINSISNVMEQVINIISNSDNEINKIWVSVVSKIGKKENNNFEEEEEVCIGEKIASNTSIVDFKNGILLIEATHPGWIQYMRMNKKFIINGMNWKLQEKDKKITNLAFRVAGSSATLNMQTEDLYKKEKEKLNQKLESQTEKLNSIYGKKTENNEQNNSLPADLVARFENLKKQMENDEKLSK